MSWKASYGSGGEPMFKLFHIRKSYMSVGIAFLIWMISSVDTTFAQVAFEKLVTLPDTTNSVEQSAPVVQAPVTDPNADVLPVIEPSTSPTVSPGVVAKAPIMIDFSGVASVNAREMAFVSIALKQVAMAKTPRGAKIVAKVLIAAKYKWKTKEVSCLTALWNSESHWNYLARNKRSGAHGIAQALPATKMESIATDWRTNPVTQIKWGLNYVKVRYGTPCKALAHKRWSGYY